MNHYKNNCNRSDWHEECTDKCKGEEYMRKCKNCKRTEVAWQGTLLDKFSDKISLYKCTICDTYMIDEAVL